MTKGQKHVFWPHNGYGWHRNDFKYTRDAYFFTRNPFLAFILRYLVKWGYKMRFSGNFRKKIDKMGHFDPPMTSSSSNFRKNRFFIIYKSRRKFWGIGRHTLEIKNFGPLSWPLRGPWWRHNCGEIFGRSKYMSLPSLVNLGWPCKKLCRLA